MKPHPARRWPRSSALLWWQEILEGKLYQWNRGICRKWNKRGAVGAKQWEEDQCQRSAGNTKTNHIFCVDIPSGSAQLAWDLHSLSYPQAADGCPHVPGGGVTSEMDTGCLRFAPAMLLSHLELGLLCHSFFFEVEGGKWGWVEERGRQEEKGVETKSRGKESALSEQEPWLPICTQVASGGSEWSQCIIVERSGAQCCEPGSFLKMDEGYHHWTRK